MLVKRTIPIDPTFNRPRVDIIILSWTRNRHLAYRRKRGRPRTARDASTAHGDIFLLAVSILLIHTRKDGDRRTVAGVARWQTLSAIALDLEDVLAAVVGSGIDLLTQAGELGLALEEVQLGLGNNRLRVPALEGGHDCVVLLIRVHGAGGVVVVLNRGVGIESSLCDIISGVMTKKGWNGLLC